MIFFPIIKHSFIKILLAMTTFLDLGLEKIDMKAVFLYKKFEERILMAQLEWFEVKGK